MRAALYLLRERRARLDKAPRRQYSEAYPTVPGKLRTVLATMHQKRVLILGSTGSIGRQTLDIVQNHRDKLVVAGLAANHNWRLLAEQAEQFAVTDVAVADERAAGELRDAAAALQVYAGPDGLDDLVRDSQPDLVVAAISGVAGLAPIMTALERRCDVALANKEPLVAAGELVTTAARRAGAQLLPIDSEISAVFQCMQGEQPSSIEKVLLTASGGPFANYTKEQLSAVTANQALKHPTWQMGPKVTIDSATLMNKGFELFELKWLFGLEFDQIEVVIHHQSIIHSLVQFRDGSLLAQLGLPDMRMPIQYALFYPERVPSDLERPDLAAVGSLTFAAPDTDKFPCLRLAYYAGRSGQSYPVVLNAVNEVAVALFLDGKITFTDIPRLIERTLESHEPVAISNLSDVQAADSWAREHAAATANRR